MQPLIVGNWKMNGLVAALGELWGMAQAQQDTAQAKPNTEIWIAPPFTLIDRAVSLTGGRIAIGGQDCHPAASGAHTGCISAEMLADSGARFVIVGHSERRTDNHETDADVRAKTIAAREAGLQVIVCVGETEAQRDAAAHETTVTAQLDASLPDDLADIIIAYEPVWAIGTGRTPTPADVAAMHTHIRANLVARFGEAGQGTRILYGGSVKPENAALLLGQPNVGGALVGGASLTATSLLAIAAAACA